MSETLTDIAKQLKKNNKKVQLIYAFNGGGKTRLSYEFAKLIKTDIDDDSPPKIIYYNAFTEDLFYWNRDSNDYDSPKMTIQANSFTQWVLEDQGKENAVIKNFKRYTNSKIHPYFNENFTEVSFMVNPEGSDEQVSVKISKGEESIFIWCIFYSLLDEVVSVLSVAEAENRSTDHFNQLTHVFVDDPVSSLDENHVINMAVNLATLVMKSSLNFIITTHSPLFYNVLHSEFNTKQCYLLQRLEDGTFKLTEKKGDSNASFSYHLYLKKTLEDAIENNQIEKYHFMLLRNLYEKTASFLGYSKWSTLLKTVSNEADAENYHKRILHFSSHRTLSGEEVAEPTEPEKQTVKRLLNNLIDNYGYHKNSNGGNNGGNNG